MPLPETTILFVQNAWSRGGLVDLGGWGSDMSDMLIMISAVLYRMEALRFGGCLRLGKLGRLGGGYVGYVNFDFGSFI